MVELVAGLQRAMQMPVLRKPQAKGAFSFSGPAFLKGKRSIDE
jgi:hypothetical protein